MLTTLLLLSTMAGAQEHVDIGNISHGDTRLDSLRPHVEEVLTEAGFTVGDSAEAGLILDVLDLSEHSGRQVARVRVRVMRRDGSLTYDQDIEVTTPVDSWPSTHSAVLDALAVAADTDRFLEALGALEHTASSRNESTTQVRDCETTGHAMPQDSLELARATLQLGDGPDPRAAVVISPDGWALTSAANTRGRSEIDIITADQRRTTATVAKIDNARDAALLHLPGEDWPCVVLAAMPSPGHNVFTIGGSSTPALTFPVTRGTIAGHWTVGGHRYLQTNIPWSPNVTGGPVLDEHGRLVGIVSSRGGAPGLSDASVGIPSQTLLNGLQIKLGSGQDLSVSGALAGPALPPLGQTYTDPDAIAAAKRVRTAGTVLFVGSTLATSALLSLQFGLFGSWYWLTDWYPPSVAAGVVGMGTGALTIVIGKRRLESARKGELPRD